MDHTMSIPVPNKSMPDMHNLDEVKVIQSRVNVSLRQCDRVTRVSRSILFQYELRGPDSRRPHISVSFFSRHFLIFSTFAPEILILHA